jgi:hypothetical protein
MHKHLRAFQIQCSHGILVLLSVIYAGTALKALHEDQYHHTYLHQRSIHIHHLGCVVNAWMHPSRTRLGRYRRGEAESS